MLYMGMTPDASLFLQQLCSQNSSMREDLFSTNVLLAGRCLTARPTVRETGVQAQIIDRLFELVLSAPYSWLRHEAINVVCSMGVAETNRRLVTLLSDERLHAFVRRSNTGALGMVGERSVAGDLVPLLSDKRLEVDLRWGIVTALGRLGEPSIAGDLVPLLSDEWLEVDLRWSIMDALGRPGERSVAADLVQLLSDERLDVNLRRSIASALAAFAHDSSLVAGLLTSLHDPDIANRVYRALWTISRRARVWIVPKPVTAHSSNVSQAQVQYEMVPWD
jgi:HEAT repeat protein